MLDDVNMLLRNFKLLSLIGDGKMTEILLFLGCWYKFWLIFCLVRRIGCHRDNRKLSLKARNLASKKLESTSRIDAFPTRHLSKDSQLKSLEGQCKHQPNSMRNHNKTKVFSPTLITNKCKREVSEVWWFLFEHNKKLVFEHHERVWEVEMVVNVAPFEAKLSSTKNAALERRANKKKSSFFLFKSPLNLLKSY